MLISAEHLSINFGSRQLLDDVDFYLNEGDKTGVIGINGTGKSTFLKVLAGKLQPDGGTIARKPNLQVSVLAQNPDMRDELTVLEQVFASMPPEFRQLNEYEAKRMLTQLSLADTDRRIGTLSGGERRRAALCAALIHPADVLVLDEPTAEPSGYRNGAVAGGLAEKIPGRAGHGHARPVFFGARREPHHGAFAREALPLRGQLLPLS